MTGSIPRWTMAAMLASVSAAAAAVPASGQYCLFGPGRSFDMLLVRPQADGSLEFAFESWTPEGSNFGVSGTAQRAGAGWAYRDQLNAPDAAARCAVDIGQDADGAYRFATVEGARCESHAGHNAVLYGTDVFSQGSRLGTVPAGFLEEGKLSRIGCERPRSARTTRP